MSAFLIRKGTVLQVNADIDVLEQHAIKRVKVNEALVLSYPNGYAVLHVGYSDGARGLFNGVSVNELREWADSHKRWPRCSVKSVHVYYPVLSEEEPEEEPVKVVIRRTRPGTRRISRVRH